MSFRSTPSAFNLPRSSSQPNLVSLNTLTTMGTPQGTTGVQPSTNAPIQTTAQPVQPIQQPMQPTQPVQQLIVPTVDPNIVAAIIAALQMARLGAQALAQPQSQPKATKMKIKEPDTYDGKS
ncbi:hypothetical protein M407DRAFT_33725 [Tulasnella calospora MUT 4182]|uniref:Uncharacterized protein n=1 Tax=Tulasnella calospora MUT 4182 TaxID=1051891 RepID=A0A0C3Q2I7_9AGAM|nr:hypothetical protein M407DRAFT_33725 [Tulasnella calospora MUT 4182]